MAYPADVSTRTVIGTFIRADGETQTGTVSFTPSSRLSDSPDAIVSRGPVSVDLNADGYFEMVLPCTDDQDFDPTDWYYTARVRLSGARAFEFTFRLPVGDGTDVDINRLVPVDL